MKDDFYDIVADTYNIIDDVYDHNDLSLDIDERLIKYNFKGRLNNAELIQEHFNLQINLADKRFEVLSSSDYAFCIVVGFLGAFTSHSLKDVFAKLHNGDIRKSDNEFLFNVQKMLEHPGDLNDQFKGRMGGFGHRVGYGHDLLNISEIYECVLHKKMMIESSNSDCFLSPGFSAMLKILKHMLIADPLSKEGLPLPGHSLFRDRWHEFAKSNHDVYQHIGTLKARDMAGASLVAAANLFYKKLRKISPDQHKFFQINLTSHSLCILFGLYFGSMNYPSLLLVFTDFVRFNHLSKNTLKSLESDLCLIERQLVR